jgi:hypothetical protein
MYPVVIDVAKNNNKDAALSIPVSENDVLYYHKNGEHNKLLDKDIFYLKCI